MASTEPVQKYFDTLLESYDILVDAIDKANERGTKLSRQFSAEVVKGQREAIALGKKFASEPTDAGQFYTALLENTTAAQGRAMEFAQAAYQEAIAAGTDAREVMTKLAEANRETAKAAIEAAKSFSASNPFADAMQKGFQAFVQPTGGKAAKKEKAAV
ncbi:MAG: hypothetical protein ACKVT1_14340 [Dehalococcoidia bacterium]